MRVLVAIRWRSVQFVDLGCAPVVSMIGWAKDYIGAAASGNPYTAIAWSGVSLLLPVGFLPCARGYILVIYEIGR